MARGHRLYAALYDLCAGLGDRQLRPLRRFAAGEARGRVLEVGCGTGANFPYYDWSRAESVDAVDPDPYMLARARKHAARVAASAPAVRGSTELTTNGPEGSAHPEQEPALRPPKGRASGEAAPDGSEGAPTARIRLHEAAAEALPFPDATFDTGVCTLALCTVADPFQAAAEIRRVLKPGGELRIVEHVRGQGRTARFQDFVQPVYGWLAAGCVLGRNTELTLAAAGFEFEAGGRPHFGPAMPGLYGVARVTHNA